MIYEVIIGESASLAKDRLLIAANSLEAAVKKANKKRHDSSFYKGWRVTSAREIGELEK